MLKKNELVGLSEEEACLKLEKIKIPFRITSRDYIPYLVTCDYRSERINISIKDGKILSYSYG